jgi:hypothetical protein
MPSPAAGSRTWNWALWAATQVVGWSLAVGARLCAESARLEYARSGIESLPRGTEAACSLASSLWVAVLLLAAVGGWAARRSRQATLVWSLATMTALILAAALITSGLSLPYAPLGDQ